MKTIMGIKEWLEKNHLDRIDFKEGDFEVSAYMVGKLVRIDIKPPKEE